MSSSSSEGPSADGRARIFVLFERAVALPEAEREALLADLRHESPALAAELLRQDEGGGPVPRALSQNKSLVESLVQDLVRASEPGPDPASSAILAQLAARTPTSSRYSIQGEVARGGMGAILRVWDQDLGRNLAMKVALGEVRVEPSGETPRIDARTLARFLEEAQVTGQLDHPGIVPVHELGMDRDGRVYFTMRLVKGRHLGLIFDLVKDGQEGWTQTRALGVLLKVCEAMAYAHANGIVHRDLKPSNVMVGRFGEVYVMDWGLAHARGRREFAPTPTQETGAERGEHLVTRPGSVLGTPGYMAPEQAAGRSNEVDERSDVYAVGAMLYELLSGDMPYRQPGEDLQPLALIARILEGPPKPLSTRAPEAAPELVAISEKAMSRERLARYREMGELGEDLRAYLEGRVVRAYETGAWAEARKWVQRNRGFAGAIAAGILALVAGLSASLVLKKQSDENAVLAAERGAVALANATLADEQKKKAEESAALAEQRRVEAEGSAALADQRRVEAERNATEAVRQKDSAQAVADFLVELFEAVSPESAQGREITARELLDQGNSRIAGKQTEPLVRAQLLLALGTSYAALGAYEKAGPLLREALELQISHRSEDHPDAVHAAVQLGVMLLQSGRYQDASELLTRTAESARAGAGLRERDTLECLLTLAQCHYHLGDSAAAKAALEEILPIMRETLGEDDHATLTAWGTLATANEGLGLHQEAESLRRDVHRRMAAVLGENAPDTLVELQNLAMSLANLGRLDESIELLLDSIARARVVLGDGHLRVLQTRANLGSVYVLKGQMDRAAEIYEQCLEAGQEGSMENEPVLFLVRTNLATLYIRQQRFSDAEDLIEKSLDKYASELPDDHPHVLVSLQNLGEICKQQGHWEKAEPYFSRAVKGLRARLGAEHPDTIKVMVNYAELLLHLGRLAEAEELCAEALEHSRDRLGEQHSVTRQADAVMEKIVDAISAGSER